jgi:adenylate kinase family enzyme
MSHRIHILGASGSGTTTLGAALAQQLGALFLDADNFYWQPTSPPFREKRPPAERLWLIEREIDGRANWVLSGSLCNWGDPLVERFTLVVFLYLDPAIRRQRLLARERQRYGSAIDPGGPLHDAHCEFLAWAASYETAAAPTRSLHLHRTWLSQLKCPVLDLNSELSTPALVDQIQQALYALEQAPATSRDSG